MNALELRRRTLGKGVYKKTVEGNPAIAQGSLARMYPGITMQGWTEQAQYEGKNLVPVDAGESFSNASGDTAVFAEEGVTVTFNDVQSGERRDVYLFGDGTNITSESSYAEVPGLVAGDYHICNDNANIQFYVVAWRNGASVILGYSDIKTTPITIQEGDKFRIFLACSNLAEGVQEYTIHPMLVKDGGELTTYEPYTGGAPSPSPDYPQEIVSAGKWNEETQKWEYEVKLTGKNLNPVSQMENIYTEYNSGYIKWTGKKAVYYKVLAKADKEDGYVYLGVYYYDKNFNKLGGNGIAPCPGSSYKEYSGLFTGHNANNGANVDLSTTVSYIKVVIHKYLSTAINVSFKDLMISDMDLPYEPYKPPQTVILTSDRPLTKWDRLEKRNGQWGWAYKSAEIVLDGSERWYTYNTLGGYIVYCTNTGLENGESYISNFQESRQPNAMMDNSVCFYEKYFGNNIMAIRYDSAIDLNQFKNFLGQNSITLVAQTAEETFVPLSESEQEALNALHTFRPTTVLSNDCNCNMTLTYKTKKSLEVTD